MLVSTTAGSGPVPSFQVVPAIAHAGVTSAYLLADDAVWCEHLAAGGVYTAPDIVSNVAARHDSLRAECHRASESLELFRELAGIWTTGYLVLLVGRRRAVRRNSLGRRCRDGPGLDRP
jgi:hypothetical protein